MVQFGLIRGCDFSGIHQHSSPYGELILEAKIFSPRIKIPSLNLLPISQQVHNVSARKTAQILKLGAHEPDNSHSRKDAGQILQKYQK
jgi:hypothetical protein